MLSQFCIARLFRPLAAVIAVVAAAQELSLSATQPVTAGELVTVSVPAPLAGASYHWSVTQGELRDSTAGPRVTFVAPSQGPAIISVTEVAGREARVRNQEILIAQAGPAKDSPPAAAPASQGYDIGRGGFAPSGWMGDGAEKGLLQSNISNSVPPGVSSITSRQWIYKPGKAGWVAVAFQYPEGNWGDKPGRDLSAAGYTELSFWARGIADRTGRFPVVQFKAGGGTDPAKKYRASFEVEGDFLTLGEKWQRYTINLKGKDFKSVISAATFVMRADDNPRGAEFFLAEIEFR